MPKASTELCSRSESGRAPPRGTKEHHPRNKALLLQQPLHPLSKDLLGHKVTECHKLTHFLSLDFSEPFQNHNKISILGQTLRAELDAIDKALHLNQIARVGDSNDYQGLGNSGFGYSLRHINSMETNHEKTPVILQLMFPVHKQKY